MILIPINHGNVHWTLAAINLKKKRVESYDSLGNYHICVYEVCSDFTPQFYLILFVISRNYDLIFMMSTWIRRKHLSISLAGKIFMMRYSDLLTRRDMLLKLFKNTPQQENGYDCGVFTCQFMESLSRGVDIFPFDQSDMAYIRDRMTWELGRSKLWGEPDN